MPASLPYVFRRPLILAVIAYAAVLGLHRTWSDRPLPPPGDPAWQADGRMAVLRGELASDPDFQRDHARFILKARALRRDGDRDFSPVDGRVMVRAEDPDWAAGWGDEVEVRGRLFLPPESATPGGFDYRAFLAERDVHAQMVVPAWDWRLLRPASRLSPRRWVSLARARLLDSFEGNLSPHASALLAGLVLGRKPADFPEMAEDFRRTGTYHLLVASGSNVGFVMTFWFLVGRWILFWPRRAVWALSVFWAFLYAGVAGMDPPVARAAVMASLGIAGYLMARQDRPLHAVFFSAGLLLLFRPRALFEAGFQMSYAATLGVVTAMPVLEDMAGRGLREAFSSLKGWPPRLARWGLQLFWLSLSAQLALAPLLIFYFQRLSWVGLAANMAAVPLAGLCLAQGVILAFLDVLFPESAAAVLWAVLTEKTLTGLLGIVRVFAWTPGAEWILPWTPLQCALLGLLVFAALVVLAGRFHGWKWGALLWLGGFPLIFWLGPRPDGAFRLVWVDAGLGDAIAAFSPRNHVSVVDTGDEDACRYQLIPFLRSRGVSRIDRLILTHPDPGHADGLALLAREFAVGEFLCGPAAWRDEAVRDRVRKAGLRGRAIVPGETWETDGVRWRAIGPDGKGDGDPDAETPAFLIEHGRQSALLTADIPPRAQAEILARLPGPVTVLQWPHHGRVASRPEFLTRPDPRWLVISGDRVSGAARSFSLGGAVRSTGLHGTLEWRSRGTDSELAALRRPSIPVFRPAPR